MALLNEALGGAVASGKKTAGGKKEEAKDE